MDAGFEAYVVARGDALHRTAYLLTHDHALAEDLVQTALAKAWPAWGRIQGRAGRLRAQGHREHLRDLVAAALERRAPHRDAAGRRVRRPR